MKSTQYFEQQDKSNENYQPQSSASDYNRFASGFSNIFALHQAIGNRGVMQAFADPDSKISKLAGINIGSVMQRKSPIDDVQINTNSSKPAKVGALAYTQGNTIEVAPGQNKPSIIQHEMGHVIQQAQGRVKPTGSVGGMPLNDDPALEKEADYMGRGANIKQADFSDSSMSLQNGGTQAVQFYLEDWEREYQQVFRTKPKNRVAAVRKLAAYKERLRSQKSKKPVSTNNNSSTKSTAAADSEAIPQKKEITNIITQSPGPIPQNPPVAKQEEIIEQPEAEDEEEREKGIIETIFDSESEQGEILSTEIKNATEFISKDMLGDQSKIETDGEAKANPTAENIGGIVTDVYDLGSNIFTLLDKDKDKFEKIAAIANILSKNSGIISKSAALHKENHSLDDDSTASHTSDVSGSVASGLETIASIFNLAHSISEAYEKWGQMEASEKLETVAEGTKNVTEIGKGVTDTVKGASTAKDHYDGLKGDEKSKLTEDVGKASSIFSSITGCMDLIAKLYGAGSSLINFISEGGFQNMTLAEQLETFGTGIKDLTDIGSTSVDTAKAIATTVKDFGDKGAAGVIANLGTASGAFSIATGSFDILSGSYDIFKAARAKSKLTAIGSKEISQVDKDAVHELGDQNKTVDFEGLKKFTEEAEGRKSDKAKAIDDLKERQTEKQKNAGFNIATGVMSVISGALALSGVGAPAALAFSIGAALAKLGKWIWGKIQESQANKKEARRFKAYNMLKGLSGNIAMEDSWLSGFGFKESKKDKEAKKVAEKKVGEAKKEVDRTFDYEISKEPDKIKESELKKNKTETKKKLDTVPSTVTWSKLNLEEKAEAVANEGSLKVDSKEIEEAKNRLAAAKDAKDTATAKEVLQDEEMAESIGFTQKKRESLAKSYIEKDFSKRLKDKKITKEEKNAKINEAKVKGYWEALDDDSKIKIIKGFI